VEQRNQLRAIVAADYALPEGTGVAELTPGLLEALGSTDGELRDELAFLILANWIERGYYDEASLRSMLSQLQAGMLKGLGEQVSDSVFERSFSTLVLNEVLGYDNAHTFLQASEVQRVLDHVIAYFIAERDLRGHVPGKGFAHAIAHTADTFRVLAQSRHVDERTLEQMLAAIADRLLAPVNHVYLYDEDERLALAVLTILRRELLDLKALEAWLTRLAHPVGDMPWYRAADDRAKLSAFTNAELFLRSLYFQLHFGDRAPGFCSDDPYFAHIPAIRNALLPRVAEAIRTLGRGFYPEAEAT
jgi:hypothetical protein